MTNDAAIPEQAVAIRLADALAPVALLLAGVPVLTGLVLAAVRYVAGGTL